MILKNLATNGSLKGSSPYADKWVADGNISSAALSNGVQTFITAASGSYIGMSSYNAGSFIWINVPQNHQMYIRCSIKSAYAAAVLWCLSNKHTSGVPNFNTGPLGSGYDTVFKSCSLIKVVTTMDYNFYLRCGTSSAINSSQFPISFKEVMVMDLTALFGAGNEPSKDWCDTIPFFESDFVLWDTPVADRTATDISYAKANRGNTAANKGTLNPRVDLNRIEGNCAYLAGWLNTYGYHVEITVKTDWTDDDLLHVSDLRRIQDNLQALMDAYHAQTDRDVTWGTLLPSTWGNLLSQYATWSSLLGLISLPAELHYLPDYIGINNMELILLKMNDMVDRMIQSFRAFGTFQSGQDFSF